MTKFINNIYKDNSRFYISYETSVMIGTNENSSTSPHLESLERLCKNVKLNNMIVADGIIHYYKDNSLDYSIERINELLVKFGLERLE